MAKLSPFPRFNPALVITILVIIRPLHCQNINTPCTSSMVQSFTPCMNFITGSTDSGTSPTTACCDSLKSLISSGKDCLCLLVTGGVPFRVPLNRTIAASLPRACKTHGVPVECKAMGAPLPAPGPTSSDSGLSPTGSIPESPSSQPWADGPAVTPPGPVDDGPINTPPAMTPDANVFPLTPPGVRPVLSFALSSTTVSHYLLVASLGTIAFVLS